MLISRGVLFSLLARLNHSDFDGGGVSTLRTQLNKLQACLHQARPLEHLVVQNADRFLVQATSMLPSEDPVTDLLEVLRESALKLADATDAMTRSKHATDAQEFVTAAAHRPEHWESITEFFLSNSPFPPPKEGRKFSEVISDPELTEGENDAGSPVQTKLPRFLVNLFTRPKPTPPQPTPPPEESLLPKHLPAFYSSIRLLLDTLEAFSVGYQIDHSPNNRDEAIRFAFALTKMASEWLDQRFLEELKNRDQSKPEVVQQHLDPRLPACRKRLHSILEKLKTDFAISAELIGASSLPWPQEEIA